MAMQNFCDGLFEKFAAAAWMMLFVFVVHWMAPLIQMMLVFFSGSRAFFYGRGRCVLGPQNLVVVKTHALDDIEFDYLEIGRKSKSRGVTSVGETIRSAPYWNPPRVNLRTYRP